MPDTTAPRPPTDARAEGIFNPDSQTGFPVDWEILWTKSTSADVTKYRINELGQETPVEVVGGFRSKFLWTKPLVDGTPQFAIRAIDEAGNESTRVVTPEPGPVVR